MASHKNVVEIEGNLISPPELREVDGGYKVAHLRIASDQFYKTRDMKENESKDWEKATTYLTVEAWGDLAAHVAGMEKGALLSIKGKLSESRWQDKEGKARSSMFVRADTVDRMERSRQSENGGQER